MATDVQAFQRKFNELSFRARRELAVAVQAEAERLAEAIRNAAPVKSGALRESVIVRRRRGGLKFTISAGGATTTKEIRAGSGETYDYALAVEYGTTKDHAEPFFFPTVRAMQADIQDNLKAAVLRAYRI